MVDNLKQKTISALKWNFLVKFGTIGLQLVSSILLARILFPEQFGLIAMINVFIGLADGFSDAGFGQALIQKKDANQVDYSTIFYFNLLIGLITSSIIYLCAPLIAGFYSEPSLVNLTRFLSVTLLINSTGLIQDTILRKQLAYKKQFLISIISMSISISVTLYLAYNGYGVWSLAIQFFALKLTRNILLWLFGNWKPSLVFSKKSLKELFKFGSNVLGSRILEVVFQNLYVVVIGKFYTKKDLGFFKRARSLSQLPVSMLYQVFTVLFPSLSQIQDEDERLKRAFQKSIQAAAFVIVPMMLLFMVTADSFVILLIKEKWLPCVPYLRLFSLSAILYPMAGIILNALLVKGRSDIFFKLEVAKKVIIAVCMIVGAFFGIIGLVISSVVAAYLGQILNAYYAGKQIDYSIIEQIKDIIPIVLISICVTIITYFAGLWIDMSLLLELMIQIFLYLTLYYSISKLLKIKILFEVENIIMNQLKIIMKRI